MSSSSSVRQGYDHSPNRFWRRAKLVELYEACGEAEKAEQWRAKLPQTEAAGK